MIFFTFFYSLSFLLFSLSLYYYWTLSSSRLFRLPFVLRTIISSSPLIILHHLLKKKKIFLLVAVPTQK